MYVCVCMYRLHMYKIVLSVYASVCLYNMCMYMYMYMYETSYIHMHVYTHMYIYTFISLCMYLLNLFHTQTHARTSEPCHTQRHQLRSDAALGPVILQMCSVRGLGNYRLGLRN